MMKAHHDGNDLLTPESLIGNSGSEFNAKLDIKENAGEAI